MSTVQPKRWCHYDRCHEFEPGSWNHLYCNDCRCKRKVEAASRRILNVPAAHDEVRWQLEENRKLALADRAAQKNEWLLNNKRLVFFDLETFDLAADFGLVMVGCIKDRGGDTAELLSSIREQILTLPGDTILHTGHGPDTNVDREASTNPFLTGAFGWSG